MFEAAIKLQPNYARALVGLAFTHNREFVLGYSDSFEKSLERCGEAARRAVALDDTDADAHQMLGIVCLWEGDHDRALSESERAVALNPSNAWAETQIKPLPSRSIPEATLRFALCAADLS